MTPDQMTADQRAMIRGMSHRRLTDGQDRRFYIRDTNIAALHFDGQLLMEMVWLHNELDGLRPPK